MKQVLIESYGTPWDVARCAEVPDVGAPAADEVVFDVLAFPINPADMGFCRGSYRLKPPLPATPGAECVGRVTAVGAQRQARQAGRPRHQPAARELDAEAQGQGRRRDPAAGRHRPQAGGDGAHQSADRAADAVGLRRSQGRRLGDPERRQLRGRPPADRARAPARPAHGQCRAPAGAGGRAEAARRRPGDRRRRRSRRSGWRARPATRRSGSASRRSAARRPAGSPTASRATATVVHYGSMSGAEPRRSGATNFTYRGVKLTGFMLGRFLARRNAAEDPRDLCRPRRAGDGRASSTRRWTRSIRSTRSRTRSPMPTRAGATARFWSAPTGRFEKRETET